MNPGWSPAHERTATLPFEKQTASALLDAWHKALPKVTILSTIEQYANIVLAAIPVNLDQLGSTITSDKLLVVGLGEQLNAMALLFSRAG